MKRFLIVAVLFFIPALILMAQAAGVIKEMSGEVELKARGASVFTAARTGDRVAEDTIVSTGFKGTAIIEVGSTLVTVRPLTRLTLAEIRTSQGSENVTLNLQAGRVRVDVNQTAGTRTDFTVQSPSATASVRGTSFDFDSRNLKVHTGTVSYRGKSGLSLAVHAGSSSFVERGGSAADPITLSRNELLPPPPVGGSALTGSMAQPLTTPATGDISFTIHYE